MKIIELTQGKEALVDNADFAAVKAFKWHTVKRRKTFYAARNIRKPNGKFTLQLLHSFLFPDALRLDHRDGDGLNNQRANLRPATVRQNAQGFQRKRAGATSKFRGVCWHKQRRRWKAQIQVEKRVIFLGYFGIETDAAHEYNSAAITYFGDFAQLNKL